MEISSLGEFGLIARLEKKLARRGGVRLAIGDDAALLDTLTSPVVTCDALVEGVHFRLDWTSPRALGWKAIAVNVSDIAAMGGVPVAAFVSLALPLSMPGRDVEFVEELYAGMEEAAATYGLTIAGGDTVKSPSALMLSVALIGNAPQPVLRSGAAPGDALLVTGTLGDSAAGLELLLQPPLAIDDEARAFLLARHHEPTARLREVQAALTVPGAVRAGLDVSDGLAGDAAHIANCSGVTLEIETARLPISKACHALAGALGRDAQDFALAGGEDYELLLCVAPHQADEVIAAVQAVTGTPMTAIGRVVERESAPVMLRRNGVREPAPGGFAHF